MATQAQTTPSHTVLRRRQVEARTGLSRSTIYALIAEGTFPAPIRLSVQSVGWLSHEIDGWIEQRIRNSRPRAPQASVPSQA